MWEQPEGGASTNGFADDKYLRNMEDNIMDGIDRQIEQDHRLNAQREIIKQSLDAITNGIGMKMGNVGLTFPLYITVRELWGRACDDCHSPRSIGY